MPVLGNGHSRVIKSLGLVFGDIGTSPIYTVGAILLFLLPTTGNILGIISLVIWTLFTIITVQYVWLAMSLGTKGEGGTIVLRGILATLLKPGITLSAVTILTVAGIALFIGDGVITPAISILSAVEGIALVPGFSGFAGTDVLLIAALIAIGLFIIQKKGTEHVAWMFGPVMLVWFVALGVTGAIAIIAAPQVLLALSPTFAFAFVMENGITSFFVMSAVILCVTGGEALYADMGHLGREPIIKGWYCIFPALVLSYLGQGAYVIAGGSTKNVLFSMVHAIIPIGYVPFLILSIAATVIASQAMISGMFSIVYQAMNTKLLPRMKIDYTSAELRSQIYIDTINWLLMVAVLVVMIGFGSSESLSSAYGLAVAGTMLISAILMLLIFILRAEAVKAMVCGLLIEVDVLFLLSSFVKIPTGAYWSVLIAALPFVIILAYIRGQDRLHDMLRPVPLEDFIPKYTAAYNSLPKIHGTALYFTGEVSKVSSYVPQIFFQNEILYENNIFVSIVTHDKPFGVTTEFDTNLAPGLQVFTVRCGYMEIIDLIQLLRAQGIEEKTIFYGIENIVSDRFFWKIYSIIKKVTPPFVQFYTLPPEKIHGVVTRVVM
ncbi:KUP/HAK/KT family potassium transporter [Methanoregula sp. UBA64]|uniref:KUP/HAK/KT family potassium transporter n=1 Tax=Methanoregula sp. UBA64 TaxID=1915554 RepID=UPI0025F57D8B|nr:KUP/HAK/KT family potassium transporter [Methanoregula sp. UBA64]